MSDADVDAVNAIHKVAARHPGLRLLVLFGSRARGEATVRSDWDLGYLADMGGLATGPPSPPTLGAAPGNPGRSSEYSDRLRGDTSLDREGLLADLVAAVGTEAVDLVDLERASGLVRFRAARDAVVVFEASDGAFAEFWFDAVSYWCDMGPIIRAGYDDILTELAR